MKLPKSWWTSVESDDFEALSEGIAGNFMVPLSPRIAHKEDILAILKAAL